MNKTNEKEMIVLIWTSVTFMPLFLFSPKRSFNWHTWLLNLMFIRGYNMLYSLVWIKNDTFDSKIYRLGMGETKKPSPTSSSQRRVQGQVQTETAQSPRAFLGTSVGGWQRGWRSPVSWNPRSQRCRLHPAENHRLFISSLSFSWRGARL